MDSIAVVITEETLSGQRFGDHRLQMSVSIPDTPIRVDAIVTRAAMRDVPRDVYVRELVRKIGRHVEEEILNALKRALVV